MKVSIDAINSAGIRAEMRRDSYTIAHLLGSYSHPKHPGVNDWNVTLYYAADALVFDTNGDPVWETDYEGFNAMVKEYGVNIQDFRRIFEG